MIHIMKNFDKKNDTKFIVGKVYNRVALVVNRYYRHVAIHIFTAKA